MPLASYLLVAMLNPYLCSMPAQAVQAPFLEMTATSAERALHFAADDQGALWIRGASYKSSVSTQGFQYIPFLGADAPRNFPIQFDVRSCRVDGLTLPSDGQAVKQTGQAVELDRRAFVERWNYAQAHAEQSFHFADLPARGELVLEIAWSSELSATDVNDGFVFSNEHGGVRYGEATAIDAAGRRCLLASELVADTIVIRVPSEFVEQAELPLVVDPVLTTFDVDVSAFDDQYSDCAHDVTTGRWLVAYQDAFSAGDMDVYTVMLDSNGTFISGAYADSSAEMWASPKLANVNFENRFLVVSGTGSPASSTNRYIKGRIADAGGVFTWGPVITISGVSPDTNLYPDCGGDPWLLNSSSFCIAWQRDTGAGRQIVFRNMSSDGSFVQAAPVVLQTQVGANYAKVSKANAGFTWGIAWSVCPATVSNCDTWFAAVTYSGLVSLPATPIAATAAAENRGQASPMISYNDDRFVLVNELVVGANTDLQLRLMRPNGTVLSTRLLSELEGRALNGNYTLADIDVDGSRFHLVYTLDSGVRNTFVVSLGLHGNELVLAEQSRGLGVVSTATETNAAIASRYTSGGEIGQSLCTWTATPSASVNGDIKGAFYEPQFGGGVVTFCAGDGSGVACPCGNNGAAGFGCGTSVNANGTVLAHTGAASTLNDTLGLTLLGAPIGVSALFFQGTSASGAGAGTVFGDGVRCVAGTVTRLGIKTTSNSGFFGGAASYPGAGDPSISVRGAVPAVGAVRLYQVWFRNSATYCTASTFNLSNGLRVTWLQ